MGVWSVTCDEMGTRCFHIFLSCLSVLVCDQVTLKGKVYVGVVLGRGCKGGVM